MIEWWWLSFGDPDLPEGQQFLGVCVVPGKDMIGAVLAAHEMECNPGGEVAGFALPPGWRPTGAYIGRLFGKEEAKRLAAADPEEWMVELG